MDTRLAPPWSPTRETKEGPGLPQLSGVENGSSTLMNVITWRKMRKLSSQIYSSVSIFGRPISCATSEENIAIGTQSAIIVVFKYDQSFVASFTPPKLENDKRYGEVTSLSFSKDNKAIVAGFARGAVVAWELKQPEVPIICSRELDSVPGHLSMAPLGHLSSAIVTSVDFLGENHSRVVSGDNTGLVLYHTRIRVLLEQKTKSQRIFGSYIPNTQTAVLALCTSSFKTRSGHDIGVLCVLTPYNFCIFTVNPLVCHVKIPRSTQVAESRLGLSGSLAFNKKTQKLAIIWGSSLSLGTMFVDPTSLDAKVFLNLERTHSAAETIVHAGWFNTNVLVLIGLSGSITFLDIELKVLDSGDLSHISPVHCDYFSQVLKGTKHEIVSDQFKSSLSIHSDSLFVLGKHEFMYGTPTNWADRVMNLLDNSQPTKAVQLALHFYQDKEEDLATMGLTPKLKREALKAALPDIILTSVKFSAAHNELEMPSLVHASLEAVCAADLNILEQLVDVVENTIFEGLFFETLILFVNRGVITELDARVFQALVKFKSADEDSLPDIENIILQLSSETLDVDLAYSVCKTHHLLDGLIFLVSQCLKDYVGALFVEYEELQVLDRTYVYLSYTLTGRQYPTGKLMTPDDENAAKSQIYSRLLEDTATLRLFIKLNPKEFMMALNEAFEDPFLNDDYQAALTNPIASKQTIVETLLGELVDDLDTKSVRLYIYVFVARNYAKYPQYLHFTGSFLQTLLETLCRSDGSQGPSHEDVQLALMALLGFYSPLNMLSIIQLLSESKKYSVLEQIYRSQKNYGKLFETCLENPDTTSLWKVIQECLAHNKSLTLPIFYRNLEHLCGLDAVTLAKVLRNSRVNIDAQVLKLPEHLRYKLIDAMFDSISASFGSIPPKQVCNEYVILLSKYNPPKLVPLLERTLNKVNDVDVDAVLTTLRETSNIDALVLLLCRCERQVEAMVFVEHFMRLHSNHTQLVEQYSHIGAQLCSQVTDREPKEGEKMWKRLFSLLLELGQPAEKPLAELLGSEYPRHQGLAVRVFTSLFSVESKPRMGSFAMDLFSTIRAHHRFLCTLHVVLETDVFKSFANYMSQNARGWSVSREGVCEGCGLKVIGIGVDAELLYSAWESRMREDMDSQSLGEALVVFQCGHMWHLACVKRMSGDMRCLMCRGRL